MPEPRNLFGAALFEGKIHVICGSKGRDGFVANTELIYTIGENRWETIRSKRENEEIFCVGRPGCAAVTL